MVNICNSAEVHVSKTTTFRRSAVQIIFFQNLVEEYDKIHWTGNPKLHCHQLEDRKRKKMI
jgi:hypothetical protein